MNLIFFFFQIEMQMYSNQTRIGKCTHTHTHFYIFIIWQNSDIRISLSVSRHPFSPSAQEMRVVMVTGVEKKK